MLIIPIKEGENIDRALKRYKRKFDKTGTKRQLQTRKQFTKPSVARRAQIQKAQYIQSLRDQENIRIEAMNRVRLVIEKISLINTSLDDVMEGWRLKRLPRIDQDILRLAYVDIYNLKTPIPVTCNEAVNRANRYSDDQGRKMINGVLRRLQSKSS